MSSLRKVAPIALLLVLVASASQAAWYVKFDGIDGELVAEGLDIRASGDGASAAVAIPAFMKNARKAKTASLAEVACAGSGIARMTIEATDASGRPTHRYELSDVVLTRYGVSGGSSSVPLEEVAFNFGKITTTNLETGESFTLDCSSGRCACQP